jgi:hypothetical protein
MWCDGEHETEAESGQKEESTECRGRKLICLYLLSGEFGSSPLKRYRQHSWQIWPLFFFPKLYRRLLYSLGKGEDYKDQHLLAVLSVAYSSFHTMDEHQIVGKIMSA